MWIPAPSERRASGSVRRGLRVALCVVAVLGSGCGSGSGSHEGDEVLDELSFTVDESRLGESFEDDASGFSVRAPRGWERLPASTVEATERMARESFRDPDDLLPRILGIFQSQDEGAHLAISRYRAGVSDDQRDSIIARQARFLHRSEGELVPTRFRYRGSTVHQFLLTSPEAVTLRLLVIREQHELVQLDYVVPRSGYAQQVRAVESSIGSLRFSQRS